MICTMVCMPRGEIAKSLPLLTPWQSGINLSNLWLTAQIGSYLLFVFFSFFFCFISVKQGLARRVVWYEEEKKSSLVSNQGQMSRKFDIVPNVRHYCSATSDVFGLFEDNSKSMRQQKEWIAVDAQ